MDHRKIINYITNSSFYDPNRKKSINLLIINVKSSIYSFKYEVFSDKGFYVQSYSQKKNNIGMNENIVYVSLENDNVDAIYFIRLFDIFSSQEPSRLCESNEPVFSFYQFCPPKKNVADDSLDELCNALGNLSKKETMSRVTMKDSTKVHYTKIPPNNIKRPETLTNDWAYDNEAVEGWPNTPS